MSRKIAEMEEDLSDAYDADNAGGSAEILTQEIHDARIKAEEADRRRNPIQGPSFVDERDTEPQKGGRAVRTQGTSRQDKFAEARARHWEATFQGEQTTDSAHEKSENYQVEASMEPMAKASRPVTKGGKGRAKRKSPRCLEFVRPNTKNDSVGVADGSKSCLSETEQSGHLCDPCRPGAYRLDGIDCEEGDSFSDVDCEMATTSASASQTEYSEEDRHSVRTVQKFQTDSAQAPAFEEAENGLVRAKIIDEVEIIFEAADVQRDYTRRKLLMIIVAGAVAISLILAISLYFGLVRNNDSSEEVDVRCIGPNDELAVPFQCLCVESTALAWASLDETAVVLYTNLLANFQNQSIIDPTITLERTGCQGEHQALLALTKLASRDASQVLAGHIPYASLTQSYAFFLFFVEMGGVDWISYENWFVDGVNICQWHGVSCVFIDTMQRLTLNSNNLHGTLPSVIQYMTDLRSIDLAGNEGVHGTIPTEIGYLDAMLELSLHKMNFSGTIPTELGRMGRLDKLALNSNQLTGSIPYELFQGLQNLRLLKLSRNKLTGPIPESIENATRLVTLDIYKNLLTGTFPSEVGSLAELEVLNMALNSFDDNIPSNAILPPRLELLNLYKSGLQGSSLTPTVCDESIPHPPQRTIALACEGTTGLACPCCTTSRANDTAMVFLICGELLPEYTGMR